MKTKLILLALLFSSCSSIVKVNGITVRVPKDRAPLTQSDIAAYAIGAIIGYHIGHNYIKPKIK